MSLDFREEVYDGERDCRIISISRPLKRETGGDPWGLGAESWAPAFTHWTEEQELVKGIEKEQPER